MDSNFSQLIEAGATIVTPTKRLSRHLSYQYAQEKIKKKTSWITPDFLPWEGWCKNIFDKLLFSTNEPRILLNSFQQQWLWEKIIRNSKYSNRLLRIDKTSKSSINCYKLCKEWGIPIFPEDIDLTEDANAFKEWVSMYEGEKNNSCWLDDACLPDYIISHFDNITFRSKKITFYGFDQLTKQQSKIKELLIDLNMYIDLPILKDRHQTIAFSSQNDLDSEIHAAACWAKEKIKENNNVTIGIIFSNINKIRGKLEYGFSSVLTPEKFTKPEVTFLKPYSISMGKPLSTYPLIHIAINLLSLGASKVPMSNLSELLNSPFVDVDRGPILDAKLRKIGETKFTLSRIVSTSKGECQEFITLLRKFNQLFQSQANNKMKFSQWVTNFTDWLAIFEWPKGKLSSEEHQTLDKWNDVLSDFGSLAELDEPVGLNIALFRLKKILDETFFQPEIPYETPIQILGMSGVTGAQFDYLWVTNARDDSWAQSGTYCGFIPYGCHKTIPGTTPEVRLKMAADITDKLVRSAENLVFSYIKREGDEDRERLSPLIKKRYMPEEYNEVPEDDYRRKIFNPDAMEEIEDFYAPAIKSNQKISANSSLLDDQSACPFRAFAKHRLHARIFEDPDDILDAAGRGQLIHLALEYLWRELKTSDNLQSLSPTKLDDIVCAVVSEAIDYYKSRKPETYKEWFISLERRRLQGLLKEWLKIELSRSKFKVLEKEEKKIVVFRGIEFHLRVDRIDKLADDSYLIIDYKTGAATKKNWAKDRPKEPQLPLYAITSEYPLNGLVFASLKSGELGFDGYIDAPDIFLEAPKTEVSVMEERLDNWNSILGNLASEFIKGHAVVDPRESSVCRYCHLDSFCRIKERKCEK